MFVARKDFDRPLGMLFRFLGDDVFEVFLNATASSGVADLGFFGRGVWIVSIRRSTQAAGFSAIS
jgi:hypothetical protein